MKLYQVYVSLNGSWHYVDGTVYAKNEQSAINKAKKLLKENVKDYKYYSILSAIANEITENIQLH